MNFFGQVDMNLPAPDAHFPNSPHEIWYFCTERDSITSSQKRWSVSSKLNLKPAAASVLFLRAVTAGRHSFQVTVNLPYICLRINCHHFAPYLIGVLIFAQRDKGDVSMEVGT
jgi:hypothetical protein